MPKVTIGDLTGSVQIDIKNSNLPDDSQISSLKSTVPDLLAALPRPVTDTAFKDARFSVAFNKPSIAVLGSKLCAKAGVDSAIAVARDGDSPLFDKDDYDSVKIAAGECWVSFEVDTLVDTSASVPLPHGFGLSFETSAAPSFARYVLIPAAAASSTTLQAGVEQALGGFRIPASSADVLAVAQGEIYTVGAAGSVKVGGSWTLPLSVNQLSLADAKLPFNKDVAVKPALNLEIAGDIAITGEFNVRYRRTAPGKLRIGLYKKEGSTFEVSLTASAGMTASVGKTDLIAAFFKAVLPSADTSGLQPDDAAKFKKALSDSIDRSLAISLNAACSATDSDSAAIVYELDVSAPDGATAKAIDVALTGDWTGFRHLPNARQMRNVIVETTENKFALNVNLLGLYNYRSVEDFTGNMQLVTSQEDGSVTITDTSSATRITVASTPLAADPDKLRKALYDSFVATACYKALLAGAGAAATFAATQEMLFYQDSMGYRDALKALNAGILLGVMPPAVKTGLPAQGNAVRNARFWASCTYSNDDVLRFFFSDIAAMTPRTAPDVKKIGRKVLTGLLDPQDPTDQKRISALLDDATWAEMEANPPLVKPPFYSDWYDVSHWGSAIAAVAPVLADAIRTARTIQGDPSSNPAFMQKRAALAQAIDDATHDTHAAFDRAFPICVMATLAGRTPGNPHPVFQASWNGTQIFSNGK